MDWLIPSKKYKLAPDIVKENACVSSVFVWILFLRMTNTHYDHVPEVRLFINSNDTWPYWPLWYHIVCVWSIDRSFDGLIDWLAELLSEFLLLNYLSTHYSSFLPLRFYLLCTFFPPYVFWLSSAFFSLKHIFTPLWWSLWSTFRRPWTGYSLHWQKKVSCILWAGGGDENSNLYEHWSSFSIPELGFSSASLDGTPRQINSQRSVRSNREIPKDLERLGSIDSISLRWGIDWLIGLIGIIDFLPCISYWYFFREKFMWFVFHVVLYHASKIIKFCRKIESCALGELGFLCSNEIKFHCIWSGRPVVESWLIDWLID